MPGKDKEHIENIFYLFTIYFPDFKKDVMRRWEPLDVGLFFDTNAAHVSAVKEELTDFVGDAAIFSIENTLELYSTHLPLRKYDLIIGNIAASEIIRNKGDQAYLCVDYFLSSNDHLHIIEQVEEHIVTQIKSLKTVS